MRVLHISAGNLYGGVETLLITLARLRNLCPSMDPEFVVCFQGRLGEELAATGAPVHQLGPMKARHPFSVWRARGRLSEMLRERHFDIVICHMAWPHAIFGPVVKAARLPLVVWRHDAGDGRHWLERWASLTAPDLTICNSHFNQSRLRNFAPELPVTVIYYPVEPPSTAILNSEERCAVRSEIGAAPTTSVIIQVSRMEAWKGHALHLRALSKLRDREGWVCWIVGGAQRPHEVRYMEQLRATAAKLAIEDRLVFLGQRADVPRLLAAADIFCQPNTGPEPFGIVFIEALYAGLPVVTTALGGGAEIVDDSCGARVAPNDESALAETLGGLIQNVALRARFALSGPPRARALCDPARQLAALAHSIAPVARRREPIFHDITASG
jgi:glycosyltransferase involved in cell wall biosynthesis